MRTVIDPVLKVCKWMVGRILRLVPGRVLGRILPEEFRFDSRQTPSPVRPPQGSVRLFIAPLNYAGQGWQWARAIERNLPDAGAANMVCRMGADFRHPADNVVPLGFYAASTQWQRSQRNAVIGGFTHVMIEAEKQPFGAVLDESVESQARALTGAGLGVMMLCHGSDIRLPSRHIANNPDSPFLDSLAAVSPILESTASKNRLLLDKLALPVLVSTPDLILDVPHASWLPVVVETDVWSSDVEPLQRNRPVVAHAPSTSSVKGSELIDPVLLKLEAEGLITYLRVNKVPFTEMPSVYRHADIVIDQVRLGDYGVAACEAMAAGRVVVGNVSRTARDFVAQRTGRDLPVVQAIADDLEQVLRAILGDRARYQSVAASGAAFVRAVHDGRESAKVLEKFLV